MRKAISKIDKIIILCKNVERTSQIYSQSLGLKVYLQSAQFVELRDTNNLAVYLQQSKNPGQLSKGYSPLLSIKVEYFQEVYDKLIRCSLIPDGQIISLNNGKIATFQGLDGEMISINNIPEDEDDSIFKEQETGDLKDQEIKRILQKIKL